MTIILAFRLVLRKSGHLYMYAYQESLTSSSCKSHSYHSLHTVHYMHTYSFNWGRRELNISFSRSFFFPSLLSCLLFFYICTLFEQKTRLQIHQISFGGSEKCDRVHDLLLSIIIACRFGAYQLAKEYGSVEHWKKGRNKKTHGSQNGFQSVHRND